MPLFVVDPEKCKRDGICVDECPGMLIKLTDRENATPEPIEGADRMCIDCGHCVAVCPSGALSLSTMPPDRCPPADRKLLPNREMTEHFLRFRRSIRTYRKKPVDREVLLKLIDIARYAPSGRNSQPVHWRIVYDAEKVRAMAGMVVDWMRFMLNDKEDLARSMGMDRIANAWESGSDRVCRGAPHLIVAHTDRADLSAPSACTIALAYLELAAPSFDIGACWAGYFNAAAANWPPLKEALALPEGHASFGVLMIGHPKYNYHRLPLRKEPRITWLDG